MTNHNFIPKSPIPEGRDDAYTPFEQPRPTFANRGTETGRTVEDDWLEAGVVTRPDGQEYVHVYRFDPDDPTQYAQKLVPLTEHLSLQNEQMRKALRSMGSEVVGAATAASAAEVGRELELWWPGDEDELPLTPQEYQARVEAAAVRPEASEAERLAVARRQDDKNFLANQAYVRTKSGYN